ncbi:hypothetical protein HA38_00630 [Pantoea allii]|nr:hypothetical protein HA38_00630 [Pantoea allii]
MKKIVVAISTFLDRFMQMETGIFNCCNQKRAVGTFNRQVQTSAKWALQRTHPPRRLIRVVFLKHQLATAI